MDIPVTLQNFNIFTEFNSRVVYNRRSGWYTLSGTSFRKMINVKLERRAALWLFQIYFLPHLLDSPLYWAMIE